MIILVIQENFKNMKSCKKGIFCIIWQDCFFECTDISVQKDTDNGKNNQEKGKKMSMTKNRISETF